MSSSGSTEGERAVPVRAAVGGAPTPVSGAPTPVSGAPTPVSGAQTRWRARLRAAIIAYFVLFNALAALPTTGEASAERLQRPFEREELSRWVRLFRGVGIDMDPDRLARGYLAFSLALERARAVALAPIEGWFELTQSGQNWHLFGSPGRNVSALRISAHSAAGDEVLYESGDAARRYRSDFLEYRRIRAAYKPSRRGPPPTYAALAERLSREIFEDSPQVERVTFEFVKTRVRLPGEASTAAGEETVEHRLTFDRPRT